MDQRQEVPADELLRVVFHDAGGHRVHVGEVPQRVARIDDILRAFDQSPEAIAIRRGGRSRKIVMSARDENKDKLRRGRQQSSVSVDVRPGDETTMKQAHYV